MANIYQSTKTVDSLIKSALRIVNGYSDGEEPDVAKMEEAREAFNVILDDLENQGTQIFRREWRTRVFETSSIISEGTKYYRCIRQYTSPTINTWTLNTSYNEGDLIYPSVYSGYYYQSTTANGTSSGSEPTFPTNQEESVVDNDITWKCIPDIKPGLGKNYHQYWVEDDTQTAGASYANNTTYRRSGDFLLKEDESSIERCFIRHKKTDGPIFIIRTQDYADMAYKTNLGYPEKLYLESLNEIATLAHLCPSPSLVGGDGHVLHYLAIIRNENYNGSKNIDLPDNWFRALKWLLASEVGLEYNVDVSSQVYNDRKAKKMLSQAMQKNKPESNYRKGIKSCY